MREPAEFEVGAYRYRSAPLSAMDQVHLVRRLAPILTALRKAAQSGDALAMIGPAVEALGSMPDEAVDYVINACMGGVTRQKPGDTGWAKVWQPSVRRPIFDDLSGFEVISITANVVMAEVGPFWAGLASSLSAVSRA
ncbi:phage tail assembly chaperone [Bosea sp. TAF32]|uniref:phage tail assembly chaperone n=1 Tax=Bosea sp. TAF32 TaxID=3237482 RepID=UPI003F8FE8A9